MSVGEVRTLFGVRYVRNGEPMSELEAKKVGKRLREARERAGLSQAEVAKQAGLSASFVRLVENGGSDIALSRLLRWTALFDIPVADLFTDPADDPVTIVRPHERVEVPLRERGVRFYLLTPGTDHAIEPSIFALAPGASMRRTLVHHGEEALFVLAGKVLLRVEDSEYVLAVGDSAYYDSSRAHCFANPDHDEPAEMLLTTSHPALHRPTAR